MLPLYRKLTGTKWRKFIPRGKKEGRRGPGLPPAPIPAYETQVIVAHRHSNKNISISQRKQLSFTFRAVRCCYIVCFRARIKILIHSPSYTRAWDDIRKLPRKKKQYHLHGRQTMSSPGRDSESATRVHRVSCSIPLVVSSDCDGDCDCDCDCNCDCQGDCDSASSACRAASGGTPLSLGALRRIRTPGLRHPNLSSL